MGQELAFGFFVTRGLTDRRTDVQFRPGQAAVRKALSRTRPAPQPNRYAAFQPANLGVGQLERVQVLL